MGLFSKLFGAKSKTTSHSSNKKSLDESDNYWLEVINRRVAAMPMNMMGVMFKSAEDLGAMHCIEYQSNDGHMSREEQIETALDRLNALERLKSYIVENGSEAQKFHFEASLIGAHYYFDSIPGAKRESKIDEQSKDKNSIIRINEDDLEDIGIISHYKGKPFTGVAYYLHPNESIAQETEFINGLKHGVCKLYDLDGKFLGEVKYADDEFADESQEKEYFNLLYKQLSPIIESEGGHEKQQLIRVKLLIQCRRYQQASEKLARYYLTNRVTEESKELESLIEEKLNHNHSTSDFESKKSSSTILDGFSAQEKEDLKIYAQYRCAAEMMRIDGDIAFEETLVYMNISKRLQDELSSPYDIESKLGKFVWGDPWKSVDTNRGNLISIIKTMDESGRQKLFENCLIVAISDKDFHSSEQHYLANLICEVYGCSKDKGFDKIEELLIRLTNK